MVNPVSFSNPKVYFRGGAEAPAADIIGAQGKFNAGADKPDTLDISADAKANNDGEKKSSVMKTIGKIVGGLVVLAGASFGMFKWKGDKWLAPEAKGFFAAIKKAIVKPGEFIDNKVVKPIAAKFGSSAAKDVDDVVEEVAEEVAEEAATKA